jgi:hypothetical protein
MPDGNFIYVAPDTPVEVLNKIYDALHVKFWPTEAQQAQAAQDRAMELARETIARLPRTIFTTPTGTSYYPGAYAPTIEEREQTLTGRLKPGPFTPYGAEKQPSLAEQLQKYETEYPILSGMHPIFGGLMHRLPSPTEYFQQQMPGALSPQVQQQIAMARAAAGVQGAAAEQSGPIDFLTNFAQEPFRVARGLIDQPVGGPGAGTLSVPSVGAAAQHIQAGEIAPAVADLLNAIVETPTGLQPLAPLTAHMDQFRRNPWAASGAALSDIAIMAAPFSGELGRKAWPLSRTTGEPVGSATLRQIREHGFSPVMIDKATDFVLDSLAQRDLSPAQYANLLQGTYDEVTDLAGAAHRESVEAIVREAPQTRVLYPNTLRVLRTEVSNLTDLKTRNPTLFGDIGGPSAVTLDILKDELKATQQEASAAGHKGSTNNIVQADRRRRDYHMLKRRLVKSNVDPKDASAIVSRLNMALSDDVVDAISKADPNKGPKLAQDYISTSNRYRQLQEYARDNTLRKLFGSGRGVRTSPDKLAAVMAANPEETLRAIRGIYRENPQGVSQFRREMLEYALQNPDYWAKLQPSARREIFGPYSEAINDLMKATKAPPPPDPLFQRLSTLIPGKAGWILRTVYVIRGLKGEQGVSISAAEMAKIEKSINAINATTKALQTSARSPWAPSRRQMLISILPAMGIKSEEEKNLDQKLREVYSGPQRSQTAFPNR